MEPHALTDFVTELVKEHGPPHVLDVEHSIQVYRPTLTGSSSVASYYIQPPAGMSAEDLIESMGKVSGFERMNLSLVSILGLDTYHQPLISLDDYAKKYFGDNHQRIVRVVGKSDAAIAAMAAFISGLKPPFDPEAFPHHADFLVSGQLANAPGRLAEVKLLFRPADANLLMKVEREVRMHLDEVNLGREISTSRHFTRGQPPELIVSLTQDSPAARAYLQGLSNSLRSATVEEVADATEAAHRTTSRATAEPSGLRASFAQAVVTTLPPAELKRRVIAGLAEILRSTGFSNGSEIQVVQAGSALEVTFPRSAASLWLATSFDERKHIRALSNACAAVRADPLLREGWDAHYRYDRKSGKLQIRAADAGSAPMNGMFAV